MKNDRVEEAAGRWYVHLEKVEEDDPASIWTVQISRGSNGRSATLTGQVVAYAEDPPFVEEIYRNDLLLPKRTAQRLLRKLWEEFHGTSPTSGACESCGNIHLEDWLSDHYDDGGEEVMRYINTTVRTFA